MPGVPIDAHIHLVAHDAGEYPWITPEMTPLHRDFDVPQLAALMASAGVGGCVAIEARQTPRETDWLLGLAAQHPEMAAVVGWVDLRAQDLDAQLQKWHGRSKLRGFRHLVSDEPDPDFIERPDFVAGLRLIGERGYVYDLLVTPNQLTGVARVVRRLDGQSFVLDHAGLPDIRSGEHAAWAASLGALAELPNVAVKLSGLDFCADWQAWRPEDWRPYLDTALELFGPARLMIGSNWPVCTLTASYEATIGALLEYVTTLSPDERDSVLWRAAEDVYRITS
jgi:L-fuconolactonase